jgi:hypothetical protein
MTDSWDYDFEPVEPSRPIVPIRPIEAGGKVTRLQGVPKDQPAICYVCGKEFNAYRTLRTIPKDPGLITAPSDPSLPLSAAIDPVAVCGSLYCEAQEMRRQDAIFNVLVQPTRDQFIAERKARIDRARAKARNRKPEEDE